ncbi:trk system potassium uptake protein trkA homolog 1 [Waddlia chondrophila 2032/99]|uniref:Trk system potassium uptake protein TrkA n=2 Tax=Waddlia chondrophila TaxID=71667 RepID=D6YSZ9_WADCW|nr:Trk system potassium transporter TrkA [Waddlia chondrophila]ADI39194.1 potassium uptake system, Trk family [Waddlia chondrophila WSU 86-1044]CCB90654.1 trk system potassium uptake protein trkA homolog 1 [Waddlia chondrophila 2032/99]
MNIVILGAGGVGRYIAQVLSKEEHNVILIDPNEKKLEKASWEMDVAIRQGSGTDWQLLDDLLDLSPDFLIALTSQDEVNLTACAIAKHLGYPRTIARVRDNRYLNRTRLDFSHIFEVDYFIGPELLVANDILKYMVSPGSLAVENFAHGAVQLRTLAIPEKWRKSDVPLQHLTLPKGVIIGLIRRDIPDAEEKGAKEVIFPHGQDVIKPGDEVTFIGETEAISELHRFLGIKQQRISSVVIIGGSLTGLNLARLLEGREVDVRLIEKDYDRCRYLAEKLPNTTIMNHQLNDIDYFKSEKIGTAEVFVACTESDEMNMIAALLGKEVGCDDVVVTLSNTNYAPIANQLGINHALSPRISTADHILSHILGGTVTSLVSFYDNQAEILEINVSMESKLVGIPLSELGSLLPKDFLIAMIQNRGRIMVANGNRIISPGDTVIVITSPKHIPELEKIF